MAQLIGTAPNQVPTNGDLGSAAFLDSSAFYSTGLNPAFRNKIINGNFDYWQRGTSTSTAGASTSSAGASKATASSTPSQDTSASAKTTGSSPTSTASLGSEPAPRLVTGSAAAKTVEQTVTAGGPTDTNSLVAQSPTGQY